MYPTHAGVQLWKWRTFEKRDWIKMNTPLTGGVQKLRWAFRNNKLIKCSGCDPALCPMDKEHTYKDCF